MPSLNQTPKYQARLPKTGFDVGRDIYFTSSIGMMLPIYHDILNQGESINFKIDMNTILQPLKRPVQMHLRQKVDLFFVPMQMICTYFGQHFYQTNDLVTSLLSKGKLNSLPTIDFQQYFEDNFTTFDDLNSSQTGELAYDTSFDVSGKSAYRLLMHLGYNANIVFTNFVNHDFAIDYAPKDKWSSPINSYQPDVFPAALLAYQAIYHNYYRLDDRFERNVKDYNIDYYTGDVSSIPAGLFQLRYHARIKDYFTSLKVSPIYSSLNLSDEPRSSYNLNLINNYLDGYGTRIGDANGNAAVALDTISNKDFTEFTTQAGIRISTGVIRSLFAVEKLNRILGRAKKDYDSQTLAHLGFKVPRDVKHEITFIGSIDGGIGVKTIESLANTVNGDNGAELGERAGSGSGSLHSTHPLKFTAPCHGVLMAIYYAVPETSYTLGFNMEKINSLTSRLDFYQPEFDKLGMQPLFSYEGLFNYFPLDGGAFFSPSRSLGWQYRYEQYKRKYDVHTVAFYRPENSYSPLYNSWSPWVLGARPYDSFNTVRDEDQQVLDISPSPASFLVSPTYLNDLFVQSYNPFIGLRTTRYELPSEDSVANFCTKPWLIFQTDPFMHAARIDCIKVSTMSTFGEPELD